MCVCVCVCLFTGLTAAPFNLIFSMHTHIGRYCAISYMILTFEVIKRHFRSNKFLCKVPLGVKSENKPKKILVKSENKSKKFQVWTNFSLGHEVI